MATYEVIEFNIPVYVAQLVHLPYAQEHLQADSDGGLYAKLFPLRLGHEAMDVTPQQLSDDVVGIIWMVKPAIEKFKKAWCFYLVHLPKDGDLSLIRSLVLTVHLNR